MGPDAAVGMVLEVLTGAKEGNSSEEGESTVLVEGAWLVEVEDEVSN